MFRFRQSSENIAAKKMMCFLTSLLVALSGTAAGLVREYKYFNVKMNWKDAHGFCAQNYTGLAVVTTDEENQRLVDIKGNLTLGWIGMYRSQPNSTIWLWEDGEQNTFFRWKRGEPNNTNGTENCVQVLAGGWNDCSCRYSLPIYCYKGLVMVNERKTWEGALDHCRRNYTGLASLNSETEVQLADMESNEIQTDRMWVGLRFLDGKWHWMSKEPLENLVSLPSCPTPDCTCGARNIKTHAWENRDCNEELNFLCY